MSEQERLSQIGRDVGFIKRWWPVATVAGAILYATVTTVHNATSTYDTKIAKKEDIAALSKQVSDLSIQVSHLADDFKGYKTTKVSDSVERVAIKKDLESHKRFVNGQLEKIAKRLASFRFYTEKRIGDKLIVTPVSRN
ncbi:hypothetical protein [Mucilaginibacter xinganensis]|uniref:Uncharacterized protein n=1 Tax=Mucilaginibacter xinganensis TaxID=1234841 RepID=A0A223NXV4_9SPHI|nr:hypothetical protein [Mucilaginibacter xinganensis]ASU34428.1 hypothetical protein MuYL_2541 [Mucilaginibacter xinganensis]